jgi:putative FmdB family regulatory protein
VIWWSFYEKQAMTDCHQILTGKLQALDVIHVVTGKSNNGSAKPVGKKRLMPMYEYRCPICNTQMELELSMDHDLVRCTDCGAQANRIYSAPNVVFKGKGFYSTDK